MNIEEQAISHDSIDRNCKNNGQAISIPNININVAVSGRLNQHSNKSKLLYIDKYWLYLTLFQQLLFVKRHFSQS